MHFSAATVHFFLFLRTRSVRNCVMGVFGRCVRVVKEADLNRPTLIGVNRYLLGRPAQVQILSAAKVLFVYLIFF